MTTDEGTPKRRRGLFRRDRGNAAASTDERRGTETFDDPWSASAWDDWDDDFTNGGARSSVPAAAAPRPEAVDAWLRSEADDFDTAARRNTKRWGGDANRSASSSTTSTTGLSSLRAEPESLANAEPTATVTVPGGLGLGALRDNAISESAPLEFTVSDATQTGATQTGATRTGATETGATETGVTTALDTGSPNDELTDWASDPDLLAVDDAAPADNATLAQDAAIDDAAPADNATLAQDAAIDDALHESSELDVVTPAEGGDQEISPIWEPVAGLIGQELPDHGDAVSDETENVTAFGSTGAWMAGEPEITDHSGAEGPGGGVPPGPDDLSDSSPAALTIDDELVLGDALEPEQLDLADVASLDEVPEVVAPPLADWAPPIDRRTGSEVPRPIEGSIDSENDPSQTSTFESRTAPSANDVAAADDASPEEPFVAAEEVRVRLPGFSDPVLPPKPASRFVSVSVVAEDDHLEVDASPPPPDRAAPITSDTAASSDEADALATSTTTAFPVIPRATPLGGPASVGTPTTAVTGPVVPPTPKITTRRWAALAAEFGSDGDLDDSFPRRPRADAAAPSAVEKDAERPAVERVAPAPDAGPLENKSPSLHVESVPEAGPAVGDALQVQQGLEFAVPTNPDAGSTTDVSAAVEHPNEPTDTASTTDVSAAVEHPNEPTDPASTTDVSAAVEHPNEPTEPEVDPWAQPPLRSARPDGSASRPRSANADTPTLSDDDPWTQPPRRTERPAALDGRDRPAAASSDALTGSPNERRPQRPTKPIQTAADRPRPSTANENLNDARSVSPDISGFAGFVGTALIGFAVLRIVLTLLGDQPVIPARYTGREASLLRIGESFGSSGSAWPVALVVGTVLLTVPSFLAVRSHLRRWAPIIGLAAATGVVGVAIGALQFVSRRRLDSASTIKLVSDVVVGPIGFGLLTLVAVGLAIRSHRRSHRS